MDEGMVESPVTNRMMKYPIYFQKYTIMVDSCTIVASASHLLSTPGVFRMKFTHWFPKPRGSKISSQMAAATTEEMTAGV